LSRNGMDDYDLGFDYEPRLCEESCPHFDGLNQCCWLITAKTPGLCTNVSEGDYCFHGFNQDMENVYTHQEAVM